MKYCEIIADRLSKAGWSLGWVSALDLEGRTIWIVDAHRGDGKRLEIQSLLASFSYQSCQFRCEEVSLGASETRIARKRGSAPSESQIGLSFRMP